MIRKDGFAKEFQNGFLTWQRMLPQRDVFFLIIGRSLARHRVERSVSSASFQTVRAGFPHTAYR